MHDSMAHAGQRIRRYLPVDVLHQCRYGSTARGRICRAAAERQGLGRERKQPELDAGGSAVDGQERTIGASAIDAM